MSPTHLHTHRQQPHRDRESDLHLNGSDAGDHRATMSHSIGNGAAAHAAHHVSDNPADDTDLERTFESALQHTRSSFLQMVSAKDQVILDLRTELARRDAHIQEQSLRISSLEQDVAAADKRSADLASVIRKMYSVRQQMDSFVEDEPLVAEILRKPAAASGGAGYHGGDSSGLDHSHHQQHSSFSYRHQQPQPSSSRFSSHPIPRSPRSPTSVSRAGAYRTSRSPSPTNSLRAARATDARRRLSESGAAITTGFESKDHLPTTAAPSRPRTEYQFYPSPLARFPTSNTTTSIRPPPPFAATSSATAAAPTTPPPRPSAHQHGTSVDGRDFFRLARRTLSYDEFTSLLTNVKAFNARQQSRQVTLDNVVTVLGGRYPEIERAFVGLMMHGVSSESSEDVGARSAVGGGKTVSVKSMQAVGQQKQPEGRQVMQHAVGTTVPGV